MWSEKVRFVSQVIPKLRTREVRSKTYCKEVGRVFNLLNYLRSTNNYNDIGAQNPSLVVFAFLFIHILHCICFEKLFTELKYLVFNGSYTGFIRAIKK